MKKIFDFNKFSLSHFFEARVLLGFFFALLFVMANGIWTAVSGAKIQKEQIDHVANNLANVDTTAFKKDVPTFQSYLRVQERVPYPKEPEPRQVQDKDFYPLDDQDQSFAITHGTYIDFSQGHFQITHQPFHLALEGPGLFEVSTPQGVRYTRVGDFKLNAQGVLVTTHGDPVLAQGGGAAAPAAGGGGVSLQARWIRLPQNGERVRITKGGQIFLGPDLLAQISVLEFPQPQFLKKTQAGLFQNTRPAQNIPTAFQRTRVYQGMLEQSNVNPVEEMTKLIEANRMYEHLMKTMQTYDSLMGKTVNDLGKF